MYENFYQLRAKPFALNPDPRFFFDSNGHRRAMSYLEYGVHRGEGFVVITGEVGAGKTTVVQNLFQGLDRESVVAAQIVTTRLEADELLRMVCSAFGLEHDGLSKTALLRSLEGFLEGCHDRGHRALLVVDEAQNLSREAVEELRMLSNFNIEGRSLLQSFLLGQPEFRGILRNPAMQQLRQRVIATYHLGTLGPEETRSYIEHRLERVGWQGTPNFSPKAYADIHYFSSGVPRNINMLCDRLLLMGYLQELHHFNQEAVRVVAGEIAEDLGNGEGHAPSSADDGVGLLPVDDDYRALPPDPWLSEPSMSLSGAAHSAVHSAGLAMQVERLTHRIAHLERSVLAAERYTTYNYRVLRRLAEQWDGDETGCHPSPPEGTHE